MAPRPLLAVFCDAPKNEPFKSAAQHCRAQLGLTRIQRRAWMLAPGDLASLYVQLEHRQWQWSSASLFHDFGAC